ncbi:AAA family ATPase [Brevibacillus sp. TJ4]|uniref:AAA family ATPase n=1 Tax=Brevibacillus sp. TJ4 TaxID=3234853 RepID=UPI0037D2C6BA
MFLRALSLEPSPASPSDRYPFTIPALRSLETIEFTSRVTFFVGENGTGKSTLLEAIAYQCGFHAAGGGRNNSYRVDQLELPALGNHIRLSWLPKVSNGFFFRAETFYQFSSHLESARGTLDYYGDSFKEQSHGESFFSLFAHCFGKRAIYLLDEPEAALSPARQLAMLRLLKDFEDEAQFIIVTHSPILLAYPGAQILNFDSAPLSEIAYEQTMHYQITKRFFDNRTSMLADLFADD